MRLRYALYAMTALAVGVAFPAFAEDCAGEGGAPGEGQVADSSGAGCVAWKDLDGKGGLTDAKIPEQMTQQDALQYVNGTNQAAGDMGTMPPSGVGTATGDFSGNMPASMQTPFGNGTSADMGGASGNYGDYTTTGNAATGTGSSVFDTGAQGTPYLNAGGTTGMNGLSAPGGSVDGTAQAPTGGSSDWAGNPGAVNTYNNAPFQSATGEAPTNAAMPGGSTNPTYSGDATTKNASLVDGAKQYMANTPAGTQQPAAPAGTQTPPPGAQTPAPDAKTPTTASTPNTPQSALQKALGAMKTPQAQSALQALQGLMGQAAGGGAAGGAAGTPVAGTGTPTTSCYMMNNTYMCPSGTAGTSTTGCVYGLDGYTQMCPTTTAPSAADAANYYNAGYLDGQRGLNVDTRYGSQTNYLSGFIDGLKAKNAGVSPTTPAANQNPTNDTTPVVEAEPVDTFPYAQANTTVLSSCTSGFTAIADAYHMDVSVVPLAFKSVESMDSADLSKLSATDNQQKVFQIKERFIQAMKDVAAGDKSNEGKWRDSAYREGYSCAKRVF